MSIEIAKDFENFFDNERRSVATVSADLGNGRYEIVTDSQAKLIVTGDASIGDKVFYDINELVVLGKAPNITFVTIYV